MKFPITRKSLQAFDYAKVQADMIEEEIQKRLTLNLEQLCEEFKQTMPSNVKEKKFVWSQLRHIRMISREMDEYLPQFIDKLKEIFIGCDIIIDPLKTYVIIDWS